MNFAILGRLAAVPLAGIFAPAWRRFRDL